MASIQHTLPDPKERITEPADSWASNTLSALQPELQPEVVEQTTTTTNPFRTAPATSATTQTMAAAGRKPTELPEIHHDAQEATTPGLAVPGAFPGSHPPAGVVAADMEKAKQGAQGILGTAWEYAPSQEEVKSALGQAGETVKAYLPESVKGYLPASLAGSNKTTLPSQESTSTTHPQTHTATGPLPGTPGEKGVAVLPDESSSSLYTNTSTTLPTEETGPNAQPSTHTATGPLPGHPGEEGVAVLPEEKSSSTAGKVAAVGAAGVATAGQGAKSAAGTAAGYVPSTQTVKNTTSNVAGTAAAYVPSTETMKNTAGTAGGYLPSTEGVKNTASNVAGTAAAYVPSTAGVKNVAANAGETVKSYLPSAIVGSSSTAPSTTLPTSETGQNRHPQTHTAVGPLPGPPGEKDVAVLPDEKTGGDSTTATHRSMDTTLPSQEADHSPTTHTAVGPLPGHPSEEGVAVLPSAHTHDVASTGGIADLHGEEVAKLPGEREGVPGYLGSQGTQHSSTTGADSTASTKTLHGSLVEGRYERDAPVTGRFAAGTGAGVASHPTHDDKPHDEKRGLVGETKDTFKSMGQGAKGAEEKAKDKLPGHKGEHEQKEGMRADTGVGANKDLNANARTHPLAGPGGEWKGQKVDEAGLQNVTTPGSTRATTGHEGPAAGSTYPGKNTNTSAGAGSTGITTASHGPDATRPDTTSHPHPETQIPREPTKADPTRHAGATEARYTEGAESGAEGKKEKHGFMDKLKGEVKILSGKLGHDSEKVEEGRKMMGKN